MVMATSITGITEVYGTGWDQGIKNTVGVTKAGSIRGFCPVEPGDAILDGAFTWHEPA